MLPEGSIPSHYINIIRNFASIVKLKVLTRVMVVIIM